jgi:hypothetical protein
MRRASREPAHLKDPCAHRWLSPGALSRRLRAANGRRTKGHQHRPYDPAALHGGTVLRQGQGGDARQGRALLHGDALRVLLKLCAAVDCQRPAQPQHEESAFDYRQQHQKRGRPHIVMPAGPAESAQILARGSEQLSKESGFRRQTLQGPRDQSPCDSECTGGNRPGMQPKHPGRKRITMDFAAGHKCRA